MLVQTEPLGELAVAGDKGVTVAVDTHLTPELVHEGYARDLVRAVNSLRKDAGLDISDRIALAYEAGDDVVAAIVNLSDYIAGETLAAQLTAGTLDDATVCMRAEVGDEKVILTMRKR